ncbi:MAG: (Fe-S)-binding protein [Candidatus Helarchaeota archaeon]|nr:(Fe-S)-binding protein [Candidatus Helarchaeota archaeon]
MELGIKKHVEDIYKCTRCGYCREMVRERDNTFRICPIHEGTAGFEVYTGKGKMLLMRGVLEGTLEMTPRLAEIFFTCTTCGSCKAHCPVQIDTVGIFEIFRKDLTARELSPAAHTMFGKHTTEKKNPYNEPHDQRTSWIPEDFEFSKPAEIAYFVGCTSSYRQKELAIATFKILKKLGVDFTILGPDEWCCGSPLFRTGQIKQATELAQHNIDKLTELGVKQILFSCAGCYRTFASDYPKIEKLKAKSMTFAKFISKKIKDGSLKLKNLPVTLTYHDACHMTRSVKKPDYKTPRKVLNAIPGVELVEMVSTLEGSMCCGAGGGVKSAFPEVAVSAAQNRVQQAKETGAVCLISTCPFCKRNLSDGNKEANLGMKVMDLTELILERIE